MTKFLSSLFAIFLGLLLSLFATKVVLSVAELFELSFISEMSFFKMYGLISIVNILLFKPVDIVQEEDFNKTMSKLYSQIFNKGAFLLIALGMSFVMSYILK